MLKVSTKQRSPEKLKTPKRLKLHPSIQRSKDQETELAKKLGGQKTIASGAFDVKADVRVKRVMRIEAKATGNKSFSVTREMVRKVEEAGMAADELPAMHIEFLDARGKVEQEVAIVPVYVLEMMGVWKRGNQ